MGLGLEKLEWKHSPLWMQNRPHTTDLHTHTHPTYLLRMLLAYKLFMQFHTGLSREYRKIGMQKKRHFDDRDSICGIQHLILVLRYTSTQVSSQKLTLSE